MKQGPLRTSKMEIFRTKCNSLSLQLLLQSCPSLMIVVILTAPLSSGAKVPVNVQLWLTDERVIQETISEGSFHVILGNM